MTESKISLIIPSYNEQEHIEKCLKSARNQNLPLNRYEIIVVDNGSIDNSFRIASEYADKVLSAPEEKVGAVRNLGVNAAKGDIIAFIDADCTIDANWLKRAIQFGENSTISVHGGGVLLPEEATWVEKHWLIEGRHGNALPTDLIGCSIVIKKEHFQTSKGFDSKMESGEDSEFSKRLEAYGFIINITRDLNVTHHGNAKTIANFLKRQAWHGQSYRATGIKNFRDPMFFMIVFFLFLLSTSLALTNLLALSAAVIVLPAILSVKRIYRAKPNLKRFSFIKIYVLDFLYLCGRSIGLIVSIFK